MLAVLPSVSVEKPSRLVRPRLRISATASVTCEVPSSPASCRMLSSMAVRRRRERSAFDFICASIGIQVTLSEY